MPVAPVRLLPLALAALVLAGCAGAPAPAAPAPPAPIPQAPALPSSFSYACPPGDSETRAVCVTSLEDPFNSLDEPALAIQPGKPAVMALGAHSAPSTESASADPPAVDTVRIAVYFTEDEGRTWRRTVAPRVDLPSKLGPVEARLYYDPALAFDSAGVLHLAGIASNDLGGGGGQRAGAMNVPFHVSTPDLGRTWSEPAVLDPAFSDRAFVAAAPGGGLVAATWGRLTDDDVAAQAAWSLDGGATWTAATALPGCRGFSPPVAVDGGVEAVCVGGTASVPDQAVLLRLDPASGAGWSPVAPIPGVEGYRPRLGVLPGGGRVVAAHSDTIHAVSGFDGGATWGKAADLAKLAGWDYGDGLWLKWAAPDPWGALHVEVGEGGPGCNGGNRGAPGTCRVLHAAFDPRAWTLLGAGVLSEAEGAEAYRVPGSLPPPQETALGDDFYAFAFAPDHGVLLWTRDGAPDFTWVVPAFG